MTIAHVQIAGDEDKFARLIQFCRASYEEEMKEVLNDALVAVPSADSELDKLRAAPKVYARRLSRIVCISVWLLRILI